MNFTYDNLRDFLSFAKKEVRISSFRNSKNNGIILRHDVDFDINLAYNVFEIEKDLGIKSTFFILNTSFFYNPFSPQCRKIIEEIDECGFEIGLHFDSLVYGEKVNLEDKFYFECSKLEEITSSRISSVSLHNISLSNNFPFFENYNNVYHKPFFNIETYVSDSQMHLGKEALYKMIDLAKDKLVQLSIHPMNWSDTGYNYITIFRNNVKRYTNFIHRRFSPNSKYSQCIEDSDLWGVISETKG